VQRTVTLRGRLRMRLVNDLSCLKLESDGFAARAADEVGKGIVGPLFLVSTPSPSNPNLVGPRFRGSRFAVGALSSQGGPRILPSEIQKLRKKSPLFPAAHASTDRWNE
jgi:hypothetical protein